ncbi:Alpha-(1,3)-fucosyltransferase C [Sergentomyia squamirostris]
MKCPKETSNGCYELVEREYFFYLSFENSLCTDYVTEKVFNIMQYYIVPVVYGGANYSQHLPPHSYIDANDFNTATELAQYLKYLTENSEEYMKYFWWKKYYKTVVNRRVYNNLCDKLYDLTNTAEVLHKSHTSIKNWWELNACSYPPKIQFI